MLERAAPVILTGPLDAMDPRVTWPLPTLNEAPLKAPVDVIAPTFEIAVMLDNVPMFESDFPLRLMTPADVMEPRVT